MNKLTLELELPNDFSDKEAASEFLCGQVQYAVQVLRDNLTYFKEVGLSVPAVSVRNLSKKKKEIDEEFGKFKTQLLDLVLKYQPKVDVAQQIKVIKELYALGKSAEEWIELFETSRAEYALTTWYTVKYRLSKLRDVEVEPSFARKELDDTEVLSLAERIKGYAKSQE